MSGEMFPIPLQDHHHHHHQTQLRTLEPNPNPNPKPTSNQLKKKRNLPGTPGMNSSYIFLFTCTHMQSNLKSLIV